MSTSDSTQIDFTGLNAIPRLDTVCCQLDRKARGFQQTAFQTAGCHRVIDDQDPSLFALTRVLCSAMSKRAQRFIWLLGVQQIGNVNRQRHLAIGHDHCASHVADSLYTTSQAFDRHFLFGDKLINQNAAVRCSERSTTTGRFPCQVIPVGCRSDSACAKESR